MSTTQPPEASQHVAWLVLGPEVMGWILQILISGACFEKAAQCYSNQSALDRNMKVGLTIVLLLNGLVVISTTAEMLLWSTTQQRSDESIWAYLVPDAYQPIPAGLIACMVQSFFANRAWKICNRNTIFLAFISFCIATSFTGAIGLGILQLLNLNDTDSFTLILIFTELWTWSAGFTDLCLSLVIIGGLLSRKTGYSMPSDYIVMKIVNAAMQSASVTTTFTLAAAVSYAIQWLHAPNGATVDLTFIYPIPALYTYSLLWCLVTNDHVRKKQRSRGTSIGFSPTLQHFPLASDGNSL